ASSTAVVTGGEERRVAVALAAPRGPAPLTRDPAGHPVAHLRDGMQPRRLAPPAHHDEVAAAGREVERTGQVVLVAAPDPVERLHQPRSPGAERQRADHRVLQPPQLAIAVESDAVALVAVLGEGDPLEPDPVAAADPVLHLDQGRVAPRPRLVAL